MTTAYAEPVGLSEIQLALELNPHPRRSLPEITLAGTQPGADVVPVGLGRRRQMEAWTAQFLQAAVEVVAGDRDAGQLLRWTSAQVYDDLRARADYVLRAGAQLAAGTRGRPVRPRVVTVHACFVEEWSVEAAGRVSYGERCRALAGRFDRAEDHTGPRWVCTALEWA